MQSIGGDFASLAKTVVARLEDREEDEFAIDRWQHDDPNSEDARYCNVVAIRFHRTNAGWIPWFGWKRYTRSAGAASRTRAWRSARPEHA